MSTLYIYIYIKFYLNVYCYSQLLEAQELVTNQQHLDVQYSPQICYPKEDCVIVSHHLMLSEQSPDKKYIYDIVKDVCTRYLSYCMKHKECRQPVFSHTMEGITESFEVEYATYNVCIFFQILFEFINIKKLYIQLYTGWIMQQYYQRSTHHTRS